MNFKYLLVYLLTISTLNLFSQDYEPIIKEGSFWDIKTTIPTNSCSFSDIHSLKRIQIDGDTLVNNKVYKKLKNVIIDASTSGLYSCLIPPFIVQTSKFTSIENIYLRENTDEKKLYILISNITNDELKEYTVCDFSLNVGDRLENYYGSENSDIELILDDIKTDENGKKVFYMSDGSYYTEGIGRNEGNLNIYHNLVDGTYERLHCYGNNENQNNCAKVLSTNSNKLPSIKLFPNPVKDILTIQNNNNSTIKIFSLNGSLLKSVTSNHNIKIDISTFKSGIYILEVYNSLGKRRSKFLKL